MPKTSAYEPVLSSKASLALVGLSRSKQKKTIDLLFRLAKHPGQLGDYSTQDDSDREIQHLKLGDWRISFWADHAIRELRVVEITKLGYPEFRFFQRLTMTRQNAPHDRLIAYGRGGVVLDPRCVEWELRGFSPTAFRHEPPLQKKRSTAPGIAATLSKSGPACCLCRGRRAERDGGLPPFSPTSL